MNIQATKTKKILQQPATERAGKKNQTAANNKQQTSLKKAEEADVWKMSKSEI